MRHSGEVQQQRVRSERTECDKIHITKPSTEYEFEKKPAVP